MSSLPLSPLHETIHKQTAKDMIRDKIISMIASGILQLGDELPSERELSTMLAVSRETVRGAIQLLAGEGVVQVSQGARTRVSRVDVTVSTQRTSRVPHGARLVPCQMPCQVPCRAPCRALRQGPVRGSNR